MHVLTHVHSPAHVADRSSARIAGPHARARAAILVGVEGVEDGVLGANEDMAGWSSLLDGLRVERRLRPAPTAAAVLAAVTETAADELWVFWSGHGEAAPDGLSLVLAGGERLSLRSLAAAAGARPLRMVLDCCGAEGEINLPGDILVLHSAGLHGQAQRVQVEGVWRGLLSWSAQRVIEQWTTAGEGVALSWADLAQRTSALMSSLSGRGLGAQVLGPDAHRPMGDAAPAPEATAPRMAAEVDHEITMLFDRTNGMDLGKAYGLSSTKLTWGWNVSAASALPDTMKMTVTATPSTGSYTYQFTSGNTDFSTTTNGPGTSGGRLYKAGVADLWVKIRNDTQRVSFYVGSTLLSGGRLITGTWTLTEQSNAPSSPPTGGWYVCSDDLT